MPTLGHIKVKEFLERTQGTVRGYVITDAKYRTFSADYQYREIHDGFLIVSRKDGTGDKVKIKSEIELNEELVSFFGLYSGDGAKGSEDPRNLGVIKPSISFSQREPNLVRFAVDQFRKIFSGGIRFTFSLGEDSAFFMTGEGRNRLRNYYGGDIPKTPPLSIVRQSLNANDKKYLAEIRDVPGTNEDHLAFYYFHKSAMEEILRDVKRRDIEKSGMVLDEADRVTASLRRPFKKGARKPGGSSRSDEIHIGGLNRFGEFFLKMLYEMEDSIQADTWASPQGLIQWIDIPSSIGRDIDVKAFFSSHPYGHLAGDRPEITENFGILEGRWPRSRWLKLKPTLRIDPLFCYVSGLYLAEGSTPKAKMFAMFSQKVTGLSLAFTSSENISLDLMLRALQKLFQKDDCVATWKIKVGSQYFPELVMIGLKSGVPMLRGGRSGDGKLRTMEISTALKPWALETAPALIPFEDKFSHVEPTGAGLARLDFTASTTLCKWFFPLLMFATFGETVEDPSEAFTL